MLLAGRLIAPFPEIVVTRPGYVALVPFDVDKTPSLTAFVEWLVAEGAPLAQPSGQASRTAAKPASR